MNVGDVIAAPSAYGFSQIMFEVVDKDHLTVTGKNHTVTLQPIYCLMTPAGASYTCMFDSALKRWEDSDIKTWLNTESIPTTIRGNFLGSFLLDGSGNPKTGDDLSEAQAFLNSLQRPILKTYTSATEYNEVATCKVWLPSFKQMGGGDTHKYLYGVENECLDKFAGIESPSVNKKRRVINPNIEESITVPIRSVSSHCEDALWWIGGLGGLDGFNSGYLGAHPVTLFITLAY